jgi:hypothetical protein
MLLYPESTLQFCSSRRFCKVFKEVYFSSLSAVLTTWSSVRTVISQQHPSGRRGIPPGRSSVKASSVQTTRTFRPDAHQCLESSNSLKLHPSGRSSEFEKIPVFQLIRPDVVAIPSGRHSVFDKR